MHLTKGIVVNESPLKTMRLLIKLTKLLVIFNTTALKHETCLVRNLLILLELFPFMHLGSQPKADNPQEFVNSVQFTYNQASIRLRCKRIKLT